MKELILLGVSVLVFAGLMAGKNYVDDIRVKLNKVTVDSISSGIAVINIQVSIYNPTPINVPVGEINGKVYLDQFQVGYVNQFVGGELRAEQVTLVDFDVQVDAKAVGAILFNKLITNQFGNTVIGYEGHIELANIDVPVKDKELLSNLK